MNFGRKTLVSGGRLDAGGNHMWSQGFAGRDNQFGEGIAVDGAGDVLVTGTFAGSMNLGGEELVSAGKYDFFLGRLGQ